MRGTLSAAVLPDFGTRLRNISFAAVFAVASVGAAVAPLFLSSSVSAATAPVVVTASGQSGWAFNRDLTTQTPYQFTETKKSIGSGSLEVLPINNLASDSTTVDNKDKFVAEKSLNIPSANLTSISYDFLIAGTGDVSDANQFYLNIYTLRPGSTSTFYDCRYDYNPAAGSTTGFTTATFNATDTPVNVDDRFDGEPRADDGFACPAKLSDLPTGSTASFFSISVGDTSETDTGLGGFLDNVIVTTTTSSTIYDFEKNLPSTQPPVTVPANKQACKSDGWKTATDAQGKKFKNQGQCVSYVEKNNVEVRGNNVHFVAYDASADRRVWFDVDTANNGGWYVYADKTGWYRANIDKVTVDGTAATFSGTVVRANRAHQTDWVGQKLYVVVKDINTPDTIAASFALNASGQPVDGPFDVTRGNIRIKN